MSEHHVGLSFGRVAHWYDGLGEFSLQLGRALAARAGRLRSAHGIRLHYHLPGRWHGMFGDAVAYLETRTWQRWWHLHRQQFALWHTLHQHIRLKPPRAHRRRLETVHDLNFLHTKQGSKRERYRERMRRRLLDCDQVVTISRHVADDLKRELAPLAVPVDVLYNGVTDLSGAPRRPIAALEGRAPFLLHVSRMAPSKNIGAILELAAAWPEQRFVLAGGASPYTAEVQRTIDARALRNVSLHLDVDEAQKAWLYAQCAGFVFPSLAEGFGLPPLEAMCFGKPAFLSRLTSLPEVGGELANYFDSFDAAAMRRVIETGLAAHARDPSAAAALVAHARRFNWERCADGYVEHYLRLCADEAAP